MKIFTINNRKVVKLSLNDLLKRKDQFSNKSDRSTLIIFDECMPMQKAKVKQNGKNRTNKRRTTSFKNSNSK